MRLRCAVLAWIAASCAGCSSENTACSVRCAPLEGAYLVTFPDAGLGADCEALGVRLESGELQMDQQGPELTATFDDTGFGGLLYEAQDFVLHAPPQSDGGQTLSRTLRGQVGAGPHDGGVAQWSGTYLVSARQTPPLGTTRTCNLQQPFTAVRR